MRLSLNRLPVHGVVCAFALSATLSAQNPAQTRPTEPSTPQQPESSAGASPAVTVEGCVFREVDVPGRTPPDQEWSRVNMDNDFVLAGARMIKGTAPAPSASVQKDDQPVGTSGTASTPLMFKIEELENGKLEELSGHRVQIDGTLDHVERAGAPVSPATELVKIRGTAIRPVPGDCPREEKK
jgi:hypothetical protein